MTRNTKTFFVQIFVNKERTLQNEHYENIGRSFRLHDTTGGLGTEDFKICFGNCQLRFSTEPEPMETYDRELHYSFYSTGDKRRVVKEGSRYTMLHCQASLTEPFLQKEFLDEVKSFVPRGQ